MIILLSLSNCNSRFILLTLHLSIQVPTRNSWKAYSRETTPDGLRSKSVISNGLGRSGSPASSVSGSNSKSSTNQLFSSPTPIVRKLFSGSPHGSAGNRGFLILFMDRYRSLKYSSLHLTAY